MDDVGDKTEISKTLSYDIPDSAVVFRLAWYAVASKPGVLLNEYSEAESQVYDGKATFSSRVDENKANVQVWVNEENKKVQFTAWGTEEKTLEAYISDLVENVESYVSKYQKLSEEQKSKLKRALVAKTCWDKVIFEILSKASAGTVYVQVAHGREMMIKATEGEEMLSLPLTTSGWLSRIESLPRDEVMPSGIATELAKKSVEWKKETQEVISRYI
ncbi:MAG: hypothetical protein ACFFD6_04335 [Candidatus Thorarchaeota archaeon]